MRIRFGLVILAAGSGALLGAAPAAAEPTWLTCSVRDPSGRSGAFQLMFDESAKKSALILPDGKAREPYYFKTTPVELDIAFLPGAVRVDRRTGTATYTERVNDAQGLATWGTVWSGSCARSAAPNRF